MGVHVVVFLAPQMSEAFTASSAAANRILSDPHCLDAMTTIPDHVFWSIPPTSQVAVPLVLRAQPRPHHFRNQGSEAHLDRLLKHADPANPNLLASGRAALRNLHAPPSSSRTSAGCARS